MRRPILHLAASLVAVFAANGWAADGHIKIFFEPGHCSTTIPCNETRTMYIYAALEGATANGITGVEYSMRLGMDGAPDAGWVFSETFTPDATVNIGGGAFYPPDVSVNQAPLSRRRGVNVAWGTCQTSPDRLVLVETVEVTNAGCVPGELRLLVWRHDTPRNPAFQCPLATLCDAPTYTKVCLGDVVNSCSNPETPGWPAQCSTSGEAVLNPVSGSRSPCAPTAAVPETWTGVKGLYRNASR